MATKASEEEVFLKDPDTWDIWNRHFQSRAVAALLWDQIDPKNDDNPFETKPQQPDVKSYEKR